MEIGHKRKIGDISGFSDPLRIKYYRSGDISEIPSESKILIAKLADLETFCLTFYKEYSELKVKILKIITEKEDLEKHYNMSYYA